MSSCSGPDCTHHSHNEGNELLERGPRKIIDSANTRLDPSARASRIVELAASLAAHSPLGTPSLSPTQLLEEPHYGQRVRPFGSRTGRNSDALQADRRAAQKRARKARARNRR